MHNTGPRPPRPRQRNTTLEAQLTDPSVTAVRSAPDHALPRTTELTDAMDTQAGRLLDRAAAGAGAWRGHLGRSAAAHARDRPGSTPAAAIRA